MPPRKGVVLALVALTLVTLVVRLMGYDFGVPLMKEADTFIVEHVRMLNEGEVKIDRAQSALQYPSLLAEFVALFSDRTLTPTGAEHSLQEHLNSAASLWLQVRLAVALASVLIVPGTFFLARRFVTDPWALFAAALMSFSLLHVFFAQQARCHALVASLAVWAVVASLWMRRSPSWRAYIAVALLVALAAGSFHSGLAVLAPLVVAQLLRKDGRWFDARILIAFALTAASVRVFYWYYFDDDAKAAKGENDGTLEAFSQGMFDGSGFARLARTAWYYEPALTVLVVVALAALAFTRGRRALGEKPVDGRDALVVASYVTPYLLLAGSFSATYERFLLPLLPHFAVFAAWGLSTLVARLETQSARRALVAFGIALLALPAAASTKLSWLRSRPTTIDDATAWIRINLNDPATEPIHALPPLDFALFRTLESLRYPAGRAAFFTPWTIYQNRLADEARVEPLYRIYWLSAKEGHRQLETHEQVEAYLRSHGAGVFIVERIHANQSLGRSRIADTLAERGRRLARFSPDGDPDFTNHKLWDQDVEAPGWPHVTLRVLRARAVGPILEVYDLP
jgi:hypothetical protein